MTPRAPTLTATGRTDRGRLRPENQDALLAREIPGGALLVVADGMGGPPGGDTASRIAINTVLDIMTREAAPESAPEGPGALSGLNTNSGARFYRLHEAALEANERIRRHAEDHPELEGMGTTLTAAIVTEDSILLAQVGDSRAYRATDGQIERLTRDQSVVQQLIDSGVLTDEQARRSPQRSLLLQALGPGPDVEVAMSRESWRTGDRLLLCSDGLTAVVDDDTIARILRENHEPAEACDRLIEAANEAGGPDNVTVLIAEILD